MKGISNLVAITWLALLVTVPMIFAEEAANTPKALRGAEQRAEISIPPQTQTVLMAPTRAPSLSRVYANRAVLPTPSKLAASTPKHAHAFRRAFVVPPGSSSDDGGDSSDSDSKDSDSGDSDSKDSDSSDSDSSDSDSKDSGSSDSDSSDSDSSGSSSKH